jgi:hypothetical protein
VRPAARAAGRPRASGQPGHTARPATTSASAACPNTARYRDAGTASNRCRPSAWPPARSVVRQRATDRGDRARPPAPAGPPPRTTTSGATRGFQHGTRNGSGGQAAFIRRA